jgi:hypothetical protein
VSIDADDFNRQILTAHRAIQKFHQRALRLMSDTPPATVVSVMARLTEITVDYATGIAPYYTGTLASSHRGEIEVGSGFVEGVIHLDPSVTNPVLGGKPVEYGPVVHTSQPWLLEWTVDWLIHDLLPDTGDRLLDAIIDYLVFEYGED